MDLLTFLILGISTWRLSSLLVDEDGPYHLLTRIRILVGMRYIRRIQVMGKNGRPTVEMEILTKEETYQEIDNLNSFSVSPSNELAKALSCIYCTSMWVGIFYALGFYFLKGNVFELFMNFNYAMAFSGLALYVHKR